MVLEYRKQDHIAYFQLNRPEKHNALNPAMMNLLQETMADFMADRQLRVGIITGAGSKAFCAGADVHEWLPFVRETRKHPEKMPQTIFRGQYVTKPLIAAINGICYGGGGELALACDIRIASQEASFRWPEATLGILPRLGGTQRLPRIIGQAKALEILLTAKTLTAQEALQAGLVSQVVRKEDLLPKAIAYAEQIKKMAPLAVQGIKKCVYAGCEVNLEEGLALENSIGLALYDTKDYAEGTNAFKEKRLPDFQGK